MQEAIEGENKNALYDEARLGIPHGGENCRAAGGLRGSCWSRTRSGIEVRSSVD